LLKDIGKFIIYAGILISAIVGAIEIFERLTQKEPDVHLYYEVQDINVPDQFVKFVGLLSSNEELSRKFISEKHIDGKWFHQFITDFLKEDMNTALIIYLVNEGEKPAKNIQVFLPGKLQYVQFRGAHPPKATVGKGILSIPELGPDRTVEFRYWYKSSYYRPRIYASYDEGKIPIEKAMASRLDNFVIELDSEMIWTVELVISAGVLFALFVLREIIWARQKKKADRDDDIK
jgi:hypothetical protein